MKPSFNCAMAFPLAAALPYHYSALSRFCSTPHHLKYMLPSANCDTTLPCSAHSSTNAVSAAAKADAAESATRRQVSVEMEVLRIFVTDGLPVRLSEGAQTVLRSAPVWIINRGALTRD